MKKKITLTVICAVLSCVCLIGTTFAWLTDKTGTVTNTFTVGNVDIDLTETTGSTYKMVPGAEINKDPKVTVVGGSEACWLFVKIVETNNTFNTDQKYVSYTKGSSWTLLSSTTDAGVTTSIYYIKVDANPSTGTVDAVNYPVLDGNKVTVNSAATATDLAAAETNKPTLAFTAYAIQQSGFNTVEAAWNEVSTLG